MDDCSTDGSDALLARLAAEEPRLRVVRRSVNSGGCGSPRNAGIDAATAPYVMFLDSDDVLPPGAVDALLAAAREARAEVAGGLCVRRELPSGREQPWQAPLYAEHTVLERPRAAAPPGPRHAVRQQASTAPTSCATTASASPKAASSTRTSSSARAYWPGTRASRSSRTGCTCGRCAGRPSGCRSRWTGARRQLDGAHRGVRAGVRHPAGRWAEGAGAGGARQVPRPRGAHVRARAGPARRALPACVVDAHPGVPRALRRRRLGAEPRGPRPAARPGPAGVARAARPAPPAGTRRPAGPPAPAVRPDPRRHPGLGARPPPGLPGPAPVPARLRAPARGGRGAAPPRACLAAAAAPARAVRQGGRGGPARAGRGVARARRRPHPRAHHGGTPRPPARTPGRRRCRWTWRGSARAPGTCA